MAKKRHAAQDYAAADYDVSIPRVKQVSKIWVCFLVEDLHTMLKFFMCYLPFLGGKTNR